MTPREQREAIRTQLKAEREAKNLSVTKLAEQTDIDRTRIYSFDKGNGCHEDTLFGLANHLGFEVRLIRKST